MNPFKIDFEFQLISQDCQAAVTWESGSRPLRRKALVHRFPFNTAADVIGLLFALLLLMIVLFLLLLLLLQLLLIFVLAF